MFDFLFTLPFIILSAATTVLLGGGILWAYRASGFLNVAHGLYFVSGGILFSYMSSGTSVPYVVALLVSLTAIGLLGFALEFSLFRRLRARGSGPVILLLAAFAVSIVGENVLGLITLNATLAPSHGIAETSWRLFGTAPLNALQAGYIAIVVIVVLAGELALMHSTAGIALRAVSENRELAALSLVPERRIVALAAFGSGALAALAGVFVALDIGISATDGMPAIIAGIVAAIFGGMRKPSGVALGALSVSFLSQACVYFFGAEWQNLVTYSALATVLYLSRHRLFGGGIYTW